MKEKMLQLSEKALNALMEIMEDKKVDARIRLEAIQMALNYTQPPLSLNLSESRKYLALNYKKKHFKPNPYEMSHNAEEMIRF